MPKLHAKICLKSQLQKLLKISACTFDDQFMLRRVVKNALDNPTYYHVTDELFIKFQNGSCFLIYNTITSNDLFCHRTFSRKGPILPVRAWTNISRACEGRRDKLAWQRKKPILGRCTHPLRNARSALEVGKGQEVALSISPGCRLCLAKQRVCETQPTGRQAPSIFSTL